MQHILSPLVDVCLIYGCCPFDLYDKVGKHLIDILQQYF